MAVGRGGQCSVFAVWSCCVATGVLLVLKLDAPPTTRGWPWLAVFAPMFALDLAAAATTAALAARRLTLGAGGGAARQLSAGGRRLHAVLGADQLAAAPATWTAVGSGASKLGLKLAAELLLWLHLSAADDGDEPWVPLWLALVPATLLALFVAGELFALAVRHDGRRASDGRAAAAAVPAQLSPAHASAPVTPVDEPPPEPTTTTAASDGQWQEQQQSSARRHRHTAATAAAAAASASRHRRRVVTLADQ